MRKGNGRVARKYHQQAYKIDPGHVKAQLRIKAVGQKFCLNLNYSGTVFYIVW
jgi:hypothetical protein